MWGNNFPGTYDYSMVPLHDPDDHRSHTIMDEYYTLMEDRMYVTQVNCFYFASANTKVARSTEACVVCMLTYHFDFHIISNSSNILRKAALSFT